MKNIIILILTGFPFSTNIFCQAFQFKEINPFGLEYNTTDSTQAAVKLLFYDLDTDGDLDAITSGFDSIDLSGDLSFDKFTYFISVQENIGDRKHPSFAPRKPFMNNFPFTDGYFFPAMGDLNHDDKPDFIISSGVDSFMQLHTLYYERKSLTGDDQFNIIGTDSLKLEAFREGSFFVPELADMDMDGDFDLLMSGFLTLYDSIGNSTQQPFFMYAKNIGTISKPEYLGWYQNPYGLEATIDQPQMSIVGDIDNDQDNDILSLTFVDTFKVFKFLKNDHLANGKPYFNSISMLSGLPMAGATESLFPPTLADLDGDGDLDVIVVQELISTGTGIGYYENNLCVSSSSNVNLSICSGESVTVGNQIFQTSGEYDILTQKQNLCDSLIHLSLTVHPEINTNLTVSLCNGQVYTIGNQSFAQSGQFEVLLTSIQGCDSTINLNLTVHPENNTNLTASICDGQVFTIGNQSFTQSGHYEVLLASIQGCDSLINFNLTVHPKTSTNLSKSLCAGDIFTIGNQQFTQSGQYEVKLKTVQGCDSIVHADLTFVELNNAVTQSQHVLSAVLTGVQYQWFNCADGSDISGENSQSFQVGLSGSYGVRLTDSNGCTRVSDCFDVIISDISDINFGQKISIFPNPTGSIVTIKNESGQKIKSVSFFDQTGKNVLKISDGPYENINVSDLPHGNYIVEIQTDQIKVNHQLTILK